MALRNWAGNRFYSTDRVVVPEGLEELCSVVAGALKVKALGSRHSFNAIGDCEEVLVSLEKFQGMALDEGSRTVRVGGGVKYGDLAVYLESRGWALHNLASLPHISVAGACATATHGSGMGNGNLTTAVVEMSLVDANGEVRVFAGEELEKRAVHLGALGVVFELVLRVERSFEVAQTVFWGLSFDDFGRDPRAVFGAGYSVSLFTHWLDSRFSQVWVKARVDERGGVVTELEGARKLEEKVHPLPGMSAVNCTEQLGIPGPWHERLPHFRMEFTPSAGEELQSEFFVSAERVGEALDVVQRLAEEIEPVLFVSEVRYVAADRLLMSPAYGRDVVGIHFTWKQEWERVRPVLEKIEMELAYLGACPHWGKLFCNFSRLGSVYPGLPEFWAFVQEKDSGGKFLNPFLGLVFKV